VIDEKAVLEVIRDSIIVDILACGAMFISVNEAIATLCETIYFQSPSGEKVS